MQLILKIMLIAIYLCAISGYSVACDAACDGRAEMVVSAVSAEAGGSDGSAGDQECECECHDNLSVIAQEFAGSWRVPPNPVMWLSHTCDRPPDGLPLGIDHPPQLA